VTGVARVARDPRAIVGAVVLAVFILLSALSGPLAPHDANIQDLAHRFAPSSSSFPLGSDYYGRDRLARLMVGGKFSLLIAVVSVLIGGSAGVLLGAVAGLSRGIVDVVIMRIVDALLAFPILLLALVIVASLGPSTQNLTIAIAVAVLPRFTRIVRGSVIAIRDHDYVTMATVVGARRWRVIRLEILPNVTSPLIVTASFMLASAILVQASLGFLGLGVQPPTPTWGSMISEALPWIRIAPLDATYPALAIMFSVLALNLLGDSLRDVLDPQTGGWSL
jgi:peptide/nickel transport system permease protein